MSNSERTEPRVEVRSAADLRAWLESNASTAGTIWLVPFKKHVPGKHVPWTDIVDELLCFGWIDSLPRKLDADRTMLRISPRKPKSAWSKINKDKVERLLAEGRMTQRGLDVIDAAKNDGSWSFLDDVEALIVPHDLAEALDQQPEAKHQYEAFPPSARRGILEWIKQAKTAATRQRRIAETAPLAAIGERANSPKR